VASDILEMNRDRKNRKNAEKMAIRVERRISDEGDKQKNRIAAYSVGTPYVIFEMIAALKVSSSLSVHR
jgi:hypothetical protein